MSSASGTQGGGAGSGARGTFEHPIAPELWVDYWAGELGEDEEAALEEHLFACAACEAEAARVARLATAVRETLFPVVSHAKLDALRAKGLAIGENVMIAGEKRQAIFARDMDVLVHRLGGLPLAGAERVRVVVRTESTGQVLMDDPCPPFDAATGELLLTCEAHNAVLPHDIVTEVHTRAAGGAEQVAVFVMPHVFEERG